MYGWHSWWDFDRTGGMTRKCALHSAINTGLFHSSQQHRKGAGIDLTQKKFPKGHRKKKLFFAIFALMLICCFKAEPTTKNFLLNTTTFAMCFFRNTRAKLWFISSSLPSSICVHIFKHLKCTTVHIINEFCLLLDLIHLLQFKIVKFLTTRKWNRM